jgi:ribonuclease H2 subunit C
MPKVTNSESTNEEGEQDEPVKVLEKQTTFDEYVVWGHEAIPAADDTFVKGVEEWVKFAEAVCYSSLLELILKLTIRSDAY